MAVGDDRNTQRRRTTGTIRPLPGPLEGPDLVLGFKVVRRLRIKVVAATDGHLIAAARAKTDLLANVVQIHQQ